ncbi:hypothetical protein KP509_25G065800 [Ceratopteris richardii]|uniref:RING-type domain-containing protein n=1 Tax=Ceratopteris richardii TaxID=49495 RepID=A0A8T2RSN9_CERRI|nr:hypothetical protein KP509_25G065800 [Ceratopteris richardii]
MTSGAYSDTLPMVMKRTRFLEGINGNGAGGEAVDPERTRPGNDMQYETRGTPFDNKLVVATAAVLVLLLGLLLLHFLVRCMLRRLLRQPLSTDDQHQHHKTPLPMKKSHIRALPCFIFRMGIVLPSPVQSQQSCPICLADFVDHELIRVLPGCLHSFHATCLDEWLRRQATCPTCRADLPPLLQVHVILDPADAESGRPKHSSSEETLGKEPSSSSPVQLWCPPTTLQEV